MLGKIKGRRWREKQRMRFMDSITSSMDMSLSKLQARQLAFAHYQVTISQTIQILLESYTDLFTPRQGFICRTALIKETVGYFRVHEHGVGWGVTHLLKWNIYMNKLEKACTTFCILPLTTDSTKAGKVRVTVTLSWAWLSVLATKTHFREFILFY